MLVAPLLTALLQPAVDPEVADLQHLCACPDSVLVLSGWRYQPGHDPRFAEPAADDRAWGTASPFFEGSATPENWPGEGWFRQRVEVPSDGQPYGLFVTYSGGFELFVDGRSVATRSLPPPEDPADTTVSKNELVATWAGVRGADEVEGRGSVVVALHIVAAPETSFVGEWARRGALVTLCPLQPSVARTVQRETQFRYLYGIFIGIALALGILHLLLDLFVYDRGSGHFDYAVFTLGTASLSACIIGRSGAETVGAAELWGRAFILSLILISVFGVRFFSLMANGPSGLGRRGALVVGGLMALLTPWLTVPWVYAFVLGALLLNIWWVTQVVRQGHPDRWIILIGMMACFAGATLQMGQHVLGFGALSDVIYIYGFVILLFGMSIHLARSVGRTHDALAHQVDEVKKLSAESLAQEQQARDEALRRMALEAENRQQAERLADAERRAELMEELEAANRELRATQAQLVQTEKMASLGQLVAGVAHEMNTPIGAIRSVHGSLASAVAKIRARVSALAPAALEDKKFAKALDVLDDGAGVISRGSERVSEIVQRLRTFARLDEAELQRVNVHDGLEDTLVLARHELKLGIEVVRDFEATEAIACFPGQLNQVFLNLVINARQAMGTHGTLTLRTRDIGEGQIIEVQDDGPGIAPDHIGRIFDPGFTTKGVGVGTGLGLAICFRIIEAHHGRLEVESVEGEGAIFRIWLPKNLESHLEARGSGDVSPAGVVTPPGRA